MTIQMIAVLLGAASTLVSAYNVYLLVYVKLQIVSLELKMTESFRLQQGDVLAKADLKYAGADVTRLRFDDIERRLEAAGY
jgi:hypothetical protein